MQGTPQLASLSLSALTDLQRALQQLMESRAAMEKVALLSEAVEAELAARIQAFSEGVCPKEQLTTLSLRDLTELFGALREKVEKRTATEQEALLCKAAEAEIVARTKPLFAKARGVPPLQGGCIDYLTKNHECQLNR
jgi:hypothetical protein